MIDERLDNVARPSPAARVTGDADNVAQSSRLRGAGNKASSPAARPGDNVARPSPAARVTGDGDNVAQSSRLRGAGNKASSPAARVTGDNVAQSSRLRGAGNQTSPETAAWPAPQTRRRNLPHIQRPGDVLFITFNTWKRRTLPARARDVVLETIIAGHGLRFALHAAVVMPDHVHILITPGTDGDGNTYGLSQIMSAVKGAAAHRVNKVLDRSGRVWQTESFDRALRRDEKIQEKAQYICANPLRAGLVSSEDEYPWLWREWIEGGATSLDNDDLAANSRAAGTTALRPPNPDAIRS
jgi:REP element-mobilizing transposase RayT